MRKNNLAWSNLLISVVVEGVPVVVVTTGEVVVVGAVVVVSAIGTCHDQMNHLFSMVGN